MSNLSKLKDFIEELHIAERNLDVDKLMILVADDYGGIGDNGERVDKNTLMQQFKDSDLKFDVHDVSELEYRIYAEVGIVTGKVNLEGTSSDETFQGKYVFTDICVWQEDQWKVVFSQMTGIQF